MMSMTALACWAVIRETLLQWADSGDFYLLAKEQDQILFCHTVKFSGSLRFTPCTSSLVPSTLERWI